MKYVKLWFFACHWIAGRIDQDGTIRVAGFPTRLSEVAAHPVRCPSCYKSIPTEIRFNDRSFLSLTGAEAQPVLIAITHL